MNGTIWDWISSSLLSSKTGPCAILRSLIVDKVQWFMAQWLHGGCSALLAIYLGTNKQICGHRKYSHPWSFKEVYHVSCICEMFKSIIFWVSHIYDTSTTNISDHEHSKKMGPLNYFYFQTDVKIIVIYISKLVSDLVYLMANYVPQNIQWKAQCAISRCFYSLVPGRFGCNLKLIIFKLTSRVDILSISCEIALSWMPQDFTDDKSTLVQVMDWYRQATSYYLDQCWPRSISPYGFTRPQWVKTSVMLHE